MAHLGPRVAGRGHPGGHGGDGQLVGHDGVHLLPEEGRGHLAADPGPGEPGPEHRLVGSVLVEIDEHPGPPLLLPPVGGDQVGVPAFELPGHGYGGPSDLVGVPPGLEPDVDVEAPVAAGLGVAGDGQLLEQGPGVAGRPPDLVEAHPGLGVEVDAQLVGMVGIGRPVGPDVQPQAAQVHRPDDVGHVGDDQGIGGGAVGRGHHRGLQPLGGPGRDALWKNDLPPAPSGNRSSMAGRPPRRPARGGPRPGSTRPGRAWSPRGRGSRSCPGSRSRPCDRRPRPCALPGRPHEDPNEAAVLRAASGTRPAGIGEPGSGRSVTGQPLE